GSGVLGARLRQQLCRPGVGVAGQERDRQPPAARCHHRAGGRDGEARAPRGAGMSGTELERILYVEDDDDIRTVATFALEAVGGFTIAACASGEEALARAADFAPQL